MVLEPGLVKLDGQHTDSRKQLGIGEDAHHDKRRFRAPRNRHSLISAVVERQGLLGRWQKSEAEITGEQRRREAVTNRRQTDQKEVLGMPERSSTHHME